MRTRKLTKFRPKVRSRHSTHSILRTDLPMMPFRSVIRLGSVTSMPDDTSHGGRRIECNTIQSIKNSANKFLMKQKFSEAGVKTAAWTHGTNWNDIKNTIEGSFGFPIVLKGRLGSRGENNYLVQNSSEFNSIIAGKAPSKYIVEEFKNYTREYRLHVTEEGCFYTCRKLLKQNAPANDRWSRHDDNSVWVKNDNPKFDKPSNWDAIVEDCVKALKKVGLDVGGFDVKVQSKHTSSGQVRRNPDYFIIECNSACSFGTVTGQKYIEVIPQILTRKHQTLTR